MEEAKGCPDRDFAQALEEATAAAGVESPAARARLEEEVRLQFRYAGKYVAYTDDWNEQDGGRRWVPKIIAADALFQNVSREVEALPEQTKSQVHIEYQLDPRTEIE